MKKNQIRIIPKGMNRDVSISKGNQEFSYENKNIRISVNNDSNYLTISNEQSTEEILNIEGVILGHCVIQDRCVIFRKHNNLDIISIFIPNEKLMDVFQGNLNFNVDYPIETIGIVETENIHKVYWVDGINVTRVINIKPYISNHTHLTHTSFTASAQVSTKFDVTCELNRKEVITINKSHEGVGSFPSGVIQYAFSYFNNFGKESSIFYVSPQYYMTHIDRGASPEDKTTQVFNINIKNIQEEFDNIRIYSIQRTSIEATPEVNKVADIEIKGRSEIFYTDTNTNVENIDPSILLYLGSDNIIPYTFTHKDGTLFLGNYFLDRDTLIEEEWEDRVNRGGDEDIKIYTSHKEVEIPFSNELSQYYFEFELNNSEKDITSFKKDENYKIGVQFRHKNGKYSIPIFLGYYQPDKNIDIKENTFRPTRINIELPKAIIDPLKSKGYISIIPLIEFPREHEKRFICQGVLNPTLYNVGDRKDNSPYAQKSWFFRPNPPTRDITNEGIDSSALGILEYRHDYGTFTTFKNPASAEIANNFLDDNEKVDYDNALSWLPRKNRYAIDRSIITLDSPECLKDSFFPNRENTKLVIEGIIPIHSSNKKYKITTSSSVFVNEDKVSGSGFNDITFLNNTSLLNKNAYRTLVGAAIWNEHNPKQHHSLFNWFIFPFHNTGGLGGFKSGKEVFSSLETKKLFNYKYSRNSIFLDIDKFNVEDISLIDSSQNKIFQLLHGEEKRFYKNYIDKVLYGGGNLNGIFQQNYEMPYATSIDSNFNIEVDTDKSPYSSINTTNNYNFSSPVHIRYRGNRHIVISLKDTLLPYISNTNFRKNSSNNVVDNNNLLKSLSLVAITNKGNYIQLTLKSSILKEELDTSNLEEELDKYNYYETIIDNINKYFKKENINIESDYLYDFDPEYNVFNINLNSDKSYLDDNYSNQSNLLDLGNKIVSHLEKGLPKSEEDNFKELVAQYELVNVFSYRGYWEAVFSIPAPRNIVEPRLHDIFYPTYESFNVDNPKEKDNIGDYGFAHIREENGKTYFHVKLNFWHTGRPESLFRHMLISRINKFLGNSTKETIQEYNSLSLLKDDVYPFIEDYGYMFLGSIIRDINIDNLRKQINTENILWQQAGEEVAFNTSGSTIAYCDYGDIYYQRYNCVGTLPISEKDENQIIDVLSFMVETRININGIYDKNRGNTDFYNITEDNYNKINPVYSQNNNFFNWRIPNKELFNNTKYNSQITWTKQKNFGEQIDTWTHITGISTLQLDGDKGYIQKLIKFNDNIISFQENGITNVMFNSRVQIPVSDGVPVEISNGYKVEGFRYISDIIGCRNKWTICNTRAGLTFIDDNSDILYMFGGEGLQPLSEMTGFRTYVINRKTKERYTPINKGSITFFDDYRGDIYYINDKALNYSITLRNFESFFDYQEAKAMFNIKNNLYSIANNKLWKHGGNTYNRLHGKLVPFSIEYKVNPEGMDDKIFTNVEYRADSFNINGILKDVVDFDTLEATTEYQYGINKLKYKHINNTNTKKRYRVWRSDIPRQKGTMNRIRNPWTNLKLTSKETEDKTELHDLTITYYSNF